MGVQRQRGEGDIISAVTTETRIRINRHNSVLPAEATMDLSYHDLNCSQTEEH